MPMNDGSYISMFLEHLHSNDVITVPNHEIATLVTQHWPDFDALNTEYQSPEVLLDVFRGDNDDPTRSPVEFFQNILMPEVSTWTTTRSCAHCDDNVVNHTNKEIAQKRPYFIIQV